MSPKKKKTSEVAAEITKKGGPDHRTAPRFGFSESLPYRVLREPQREEQARLEKAYNEAEAKNISLGGLCLKVRDSLKCGSVLEIQIPSVFSDGSVNVEAQVMWCEAIKNEPYVGVAFQSLTDEASVSIQKLIRQLG